MDRNKIILLIVLVLIVAAYIFFVVWGATSDDNKGGSGNPKKTPVTADNYSPYPVTQRAGNLMGDWLGRFLPKPDIPCAVPAAKDAELICESVAVDTNINIPAKKGASFRIATLVLKQGKAHVEYEDNTDSAEKAEMDEQDFDLPDTKHNSNKSTIIIFEDGGKLRISCRDNTNCKVGLK